MRDKYHHSQGVRIGDTIRIAGQGGWDESLEIPDDPKSQIRNACESIARVLAEAGASWADVVEITSYHVGEIDEAVLGTLVEELRKSCPSHQPLWTVLGVERLAFPQMRIEITATALLSE